MQVYQGVARAGETTVCTGQIDNLIDYSVRDTGQHILGTALCDGLAQQQ